jgi:DNA-binding NtrC family response regulator
LILGLLERAAGDLSAATGHFAASLKFAHEAQDVEQAAWAALHQFRMIAETKPGDGLIAGHLSDARRLVALAADPHISAYLHDSIALLESSGGRSAEARRHLRTCATLLETAPNSWLEQLAAISAFFLDFLEARFENALSHLKTARRLMPLVGSRQRSLIDCNEGHALLALGRFEEAMERLNHLASGKPSLATLAALDGLARAYLATDQLDRCRETLAHFQQVAERDTSLSTAFAGRWTSITRTKLLLRLGLFQDACNQLENDVSQAERLADRLLVGFLKCLQAEALAGAGRSSDAARALVRIEIDGHLSTPDCIASYSRAAGVVLRRSGERLSRTQLRRARAIWEAHNNHCALSEMEHLRIELSSPLTQNSSHGRAITAVTHLASVTQVAYSARLLGRELLHAINALHCGVDAELVHSDALSAHTDDGQVQMALGDTRESLTLRCRIPSEPLKATLLADVLRIGRAALALERFQQAERNRAALWPADPVETEAGALFLAEPMQRLLATARRAAASNVPVLITGETGTGKEVLARLIHAYSPRAKATFLPFNCTATPRDMLDSQLFGHRRGAFTGAVEHFQGVIRAAAGGTLFLDEIGEATPDVQPKLLRFLESSEVHPIGETHPSRVDVRLIAATNADLRTLVAQGRFREDLYYRLDVVPLHIPPLRERRVEIPALAHHYLRKFAQEHHRGDLRLAEETIEFLVLYRWPGNVRQLANEMRRLTVLAEKGAVLMPEHLHPDIIASRRTVPASERHLEPTEVVVRLDQPLDAGVGHVERAMIKYALDKCGGRLEETAAMLGISRKGLYLKRQRYGFEGPATLTREEAELAESA